MKENGTAFHGPGASDIGEKDKILGRIREALRITAPPPGHALDGSAHGSVNLPQVESVRKWLPAVGEHLEERLQMFRQNAAILRVEFHLLESRQEFLQHLSKLKAAENWVKIGAHGGELVDAACRELNLPTCRTDRAYSVTDLESCNAGITECDALVAQTGSVLVTSKSAGGRALSVLPPHHVVLARRGQLLADLPEAFALLKRRYESNYPSFISFITGPSRTGDIERILVLGAHGPKKLTVLCL